MPVLQTSVIFLLKRNVDDWAEDHFGPVFAVEYLLLRKECTIKYLRHWRVFSVVEKYYVYQKAFLYADIKSISFFPPLLIFPPILLSVLAFHFLRTLVPPNKFTITTEASPVWTVVFYWINRALLLEIVVLNAVHTTVSEHLHLSKAIFCSNAGAVP